MQRRPAVASRTLIELRAQLRGGLRERRQSMHKCPDIEHCSAHQQRHAATRMDLCDAGNRVRHETPGGVAFSRLTDVDEVMWNTLTHRARRLCGSNVEASVDESGVYADDFDGSLLSKTNGPITLAHTRRT